MITAIFQVRYGSTRLQGKMLELIEGKPLIAHIIERVQAAKSLDQIVIATTSNPNNRPLLNYLETTRLPLFLGSEEDVLDRFYQAAKEFKASVIVRITPDDPFKDPEVIDRAVKLFQTANPRVDYVSNCSYDGSIRSSFPEGIDVEVLSFTCLEKMWREATRPSEREHLTPYLFAHPEKFQTLGFYHTENLSHLRWTIDYVKDLELAQEVYRELYPQKKIFLMQDILDLLDKRPELKTLNKGTPRYEGYKKSVVKETLCNG